MNHGSVFTGLLGFEIAATLMGWQNVFMCEKEEFLQKIIKYWYPDSIHYGAIETTDFTVHRGRIDVLTGGFPCQPYSRAGERRGTDDERHLWPQMFRAVREAAPRWVVAENVYGLVDWNGGLVFEDVQVDLENEGYQVQAYVLPAASVGAPHFRDRVWIVAYSGRAGAGNTGGETCHKGRHPGQDRGAGIRCSDWPFGSSGVDAASSDVTHPEGVGCKDGPTPNEWPASGKKHPPCDSAQVSIRKPAPDTDGEVRATKRPASEAVPGPETEHGSGRRDRLHDAPNPEIPDDGGGIDRSQERQAQQSRDGSLKKDFADTSAIGLQGSVHERDRRSPGQGIEPGREAPGADSQGYWQHFPTQPPVCGGDDGVSRDLDGITFSSWRRKSIEAYGNAVVPQVVLQIFKAIQQYENGSF